MYLVVGYRIWGHAVNDKARCGAEGSGPRSQVSEPPGATAILPKDLFGLARDGIILSCMGKKPAVNAPCPCGSGIKYKKCCGGPLPRDGRLASAAAGSRKASDSGTEPSTSKARLQLRVADWRADPGLTCPCGSKKAYGLCCEPFIAKGSSAGSLSKQALEQLNAGDIVQAEALYRAQFAQDVGWIHEHTLPFVVAKTPIIEKLVEIDTESLVELADTISYCLSRLERTSEIVPFLDHVESVVPLVGFGKHVSYLRATWLHIALDDQSGARLELEKLGDILTYHRREALELYLDVFGPGIPERRRIVIAENIVRQSAGEDHVRVQYTAIKAIGLFLLGEGPQALEELRTLLAAISPPAHIETSDELMTEWQLANAWSLYGAFSQDGCCPFEGRRIAPTDSGKHVEASRQGETFAGSGVAASRPGTVSRRCKSLRR